MTGILGQLKWESLKKRRKDSRLILLYKGLEGKARIPTDDLIPKNRRCRNQHSLAFQIPSASKEAYKSSFFPQTIRDWNDLPDSLISSAEMSDDCVQVRFTRAFKGLIFPPSEPPGEIMSFGVSPVNYSDSDGNQSSDPTWPKPNATFPPSSIMLQIKFDCDWPCCLRDIQD